MATKHETTYEKNFAFLRVGSVYADRIKSSEKKAHKAFKYALERVLERSKKHHAEYTERVEQIDIEFCATEPPDDPKGVIKKDAQGGLCYTKEGNKHRNQDRNKLWREGKVEITPHMAKFVPDDLTFEEREAFRGFVIPDVDEPEPDWDAEEAKAPTPAPDPSQTHDA